jgi:hypothetical protein
MVEKRMNNSAFPYLAISLYIVGPILGSELFLEPQSLGRERTRSVLDR